jgi:hypothetical protein
MVGPPIAAAMPFGVPVPKRFLLPLVTAAAVALSLGVAACSHSEANGPGIVTTLPTYTPSAGSGDPMMSATGSSSADGSPSMTPTSDAPDASTPTVTPSGTATTGAAATGKTVTVVPTRATKTLASYAAISISPLPSSGHVGDEIVESYVAALAMTDEAYSRPKQSWIDTADRLLSPPYKQEFLDSVEVLRGAGLHAIGHLQATGRLTAISANKATIEACLNTSNRDIVDESGNSVSAANAEGNLWQYKSVAKLTFEIDRWKLSEATEYRDQSC